MRTVDALSFEIASGIRNAAARNSATAAGFCLASFSDEVRQVAATEK